MVRYLSVFLAALLLLLPSLGAAQIGRGAIGGVVKDESGGAPPGAGDPRTVGVTLRVALKGQ